MVEIVMGCLVSLMVVEEGAPSQDVVGMMAWFSFLFLFDHSFLL